MKYQLLIFFMLFCLASHASAFSLPAGRQATPPQHPPSASAVPASGLIDNFEDGDISVGPEWWAFDSIELSSSSNPALGAWSLEVKGKAVDWYAGGMGTYLARPKLDFSIFSFLEMDIYGFGQRSGTIKIELYDDDNNNWQIEQDPKNGFQPVYDDRFAYEIRIDWSGWKHLKIPLANFVDSNPAAGDNIWNPQKQGNSGGLLQMQLITLASSKAGTAHYILDNISFTSQ